MHPKAAFSLLKETFQEWQKDGALQLGAALSYYTIFSLAPLLLIVIAAAGLIFGEEAVQGQIVGQIQGLVGRQGAEAVQTMIANAGRQQGSGVLATVFGLVTILVGATGVFTQLQSSLNHIWEVESKPRGIKGILLDRATSFGMVLGIGFLLLVSLILSAALAAVDQYLTGLLPALETLLRVVGFVVSFGLITLLFAMMYKVLPDAKIAWRDVWFGAAATALLFTIGKLLIGLYLGNSGVASTYGAAGSLVILLLWIYYSAQILFFGAELTQVWARRSGRQIEPNEDAVRVKEIKVEGKEAEEVERAEEPRGRRRPEVRPAARV